MKKLLVIAGLLFLGNVIHAQITLSSTSYPASLLGTDNLKKTVYNSPFPSFAPMSGTLCDMTSLVDTTPVYSLYHVPGMSIYDFADSINYSFLLSSYHGNLQLIKSTSSLAEYGIEIFPSAYSLTALTAGPFDSAFIQSQICPFSFPHERIYFPATIGSSWSSAWHSDVTFEVSVSLYSLNHAPGIIRHYTFESNIAIGWGMMRVNDAAGIPSQYLDVLQVTTVTQTVDSYFLAGAPMPPIVLVALSLTQGKTDTTYTQNFYREREVTPLASVAFKDAAFTQPYKATTHVQRLWPAGVNEVAAEPVGSFPNPLRGSILTLHLPSNGDWSYQLINLSGSVLQSGNINGIQQNGTLEINETTSPGVYYLRMSDGNRVYSQQIIISQ